MTINLLMNCFQLAGPTDNTNPKIENSDIHFAFKPQMTNETSERSGTSSNSAQLGAAELSSDRLENRINDLRMLLSNKDRNRLIKQKNGNGKKTLKIIHWNMTKKHWENKIDKIENTIVDFKPNLFLISEANYFDNNPEYEMNMRGYSVVHSPI